MGALEFKSSLNDPSKLTKIQTDFLLQNTHFSEEEIKKWHTGFIKDYPKGYLHRKQFIEIYKEFYTHGKGEKFCKYVFKAFDKDGNNEIDFVEFLVAISIIAHGDVKKKLQAAFDIFDIDKNGKIDKKEMEKLITEIYDLIGEVNCDGDNSPSNRVKQIMKVLDKNMDGTVSIDEFIEGCMNDQHLRNLLTPTLTSPNQVYKNA